MLKKNALRLAVCLLGAMLLTTNVNNVNTYKIKRVWEFISTKSHQGHHMDNHEILDAHNCCACIWVKCSCGFECYTSDFYTASYLWNHLRNKCDERIEPRAIARSRFVYPGFNPSLTMFMAPKK